MTSNGKEFQGILRNPEVHHRINNSSPLVLS